MPFLVWTGVEEWLTESAAVDLRKDGLSASGIQLGAEPAPFRVDYRLEAPDFVTRELEVTGTGQGWHRHLRLRHDGSGGWEAEVRDEGDVPDGPWTARWRIWSGRPNTTSRNCLLPTPW